MSTTSALQTVTGLGSGLDINSIISQLDTAERASAAPLQTEQTTIASEQQAWSDWNTRLLAINTDAVNLTNLSTQLTQQATSSDSSVGVTAGTGAVAGTYTFTVDSLATAQQLASDNTYASTDLVGSGTLKLTVGGTGGKETDVAVKSGATLSDLVTAINGSGAGVQASVITESNNVQRLMLVAQTPGSAGAMTLDWSGVTGGTTPSMTRVLATPTDTNITFAEGTSNAFTVTRSSNSLTDVITGLTMNLSSASVGKTVTVNVTPNTDSIAQPITDLVTQYNNLVDTFNTDNSFDTTSDTSGVLFGNNTLESSFNDLTSMLTSKPTGVTGSITSLADIGITLDKTGKLQIDQTKLTNALNTNASAVYNLFGLTKTVSNPNVTYLSSTDATQSSGTDGYAVNITQLATKASLTLGTDLPTALAQDETLTVNGTAIALTAGSTASQIVDAINQQSSTTSITASLGGDGNQLVLTQNIYGSAPLVSVSSNLAANVAGSTGIGVTALTAAAPGDGNTGAAGLDVAGTIGGNAATGQGQVLTGSAGASNGVKLSINATTLGDGNFGTVNITRGIGSLISTRLSALTDPVSGAIQTEVNGLTTENTDLQTQIDAINTSADAETARLQTEYNNMDLAISELRNQSTAFTSMIDGLNGASSSSSGSSSSSSSSSSGSSGSSSSSGTSGS